MKICLIIEQDRELWKRTFIRLHMLGFKWDRTEQPLNDFHFLDSVLKAGAKGIGINFKEKTVTWTAMPSKFFKYCIEVKK